MGLGPSGHGVGSARVRVGVNVGGWVGGYVGDGCVGMCGPAWRALTYVGEHVHTWVGVRAPLHMCP